MTNLTDKFSALESQMATEHTEVLARFTAIDDALALVNTALETLNSNGAVNTQYLLAALSGLDPCQSCETPPSLTPVDPITTPNDVNDLHCQRAQALLDAIRKMLVKLDLVSTLGVGFSSSVVSAAINEVIADLTSIGTWPFPSFIETSTLLGSTLAYIASNIVRGDHLVPLFDSLRTSLTSALYGATTGADALTAYNAVISGSSLPADEQGVLSAVAFVSWFNLVYDPSSTLDVSAYDGTVCAVPGCYSLASVAFTNTIGPSGNAIGSTFGPFTPQTTIGTSSGDSTTDPATYYSVSPNHWTMEVTSGTARVVHRPGGPSTSGTLNVLGIFTAGPDLIELPDAGTWYIDSWNGSSYDGPFTVVICPPPS